jgi:P27 family predicted phage terminase small subunit
MARGRKPKPTNLKIITGNPGKRALNKKEPQPGRASRKTPTEFLVNRAEPGKVDNDFVAPNAAEEAAKAFKMLQDELANMKLITKVDTALLSTYCQAYGFWKEASAMVNRLGMVTKTSNGNLIQNPFLAIVNKQALAWMLAIQQKMMNS